MPSTFYKIKCNSHFSTKNEMGISTEKGAEHCLTPYVLKHWFQSVNPYRCIFPSLIFLSILKLKLLFHDLSPANSISFKGLNFESKRCNSFCQIIWHILGYRSNTLNISFWNFQVRYHDFITILIIMWIFLYDKQ